MGNDHIEEDEDDEETQAFLSLARNAVADADGVPADVQALAKMAFEFRDLETVELVDTAELAGVRSGSGDSTMQVTKDGLTIVWSLDQAKVLGVVHSDGSLPLLQLQTPTDATAVEVLPEDGTFEFDVPPSAYRLIVAVGDTNWATPWTVSYTHLTLPTKA